MGRWPGRAEPRDQEAPGADRQAAREELKNFRERVIRIIAEDEDAVDQVYRLNLQFFPLSKRIKGDTKGDKEGVDDK